MSGSRQAFAALAIVVVLASVSVSSADGPTVTAVRYWTAPDHTRVVVDLSSECDHSTRVLTGPDRIVVHVAGGSIGEAATRTDVGDGLVERVRLNQLRSGAQVVLDLVEPSPHNVFSLRPYAGKPDRIVVDVFQEGREVRPTAPSAATGHRVIIIDPGHGGEDPGTLGNGELREKDVVLDIGKMLAAELRSRPGYEVRLTRDGDYFVPLGKRKRIARDASGHIFVSIHANSAPSRRAQGTEVFFVSPRGASDQAARELADRENAADLVGGVSPDADDDVLSILVDLKMDDSVKKSNDLATIVSRRLEETGVSESVVKQAGFLVLKSLSMPSVLVEVGFLSNSSDVRRLKDRDYRRRYAACLADAIDAYAERYASAVVSTEGTHTVAAGETLWSIARRYETTVDELRLLNSLDEDARIAVGQVLAVR